MEVLEVMHSFSQCLLHRTVDGGAGGCSDWVGVIVLDTAEAPVKVIDDDGDDEDGSGGERRGAGWSK